MTLGWSLQTAVLPQLCQKRAQDGGGKLEGEGTCSFLCVCCLSEWILYLAAAAASIEVGSSLQFSHLARRRFRPIRVRGTTPDTLNTFSSEVWLLKGPSS